MREIPVKSNLISDVLRYLFYLTYSKPKRMETRILLTLELQDQRIDGLTHLVKIISNKQQRLLEEALIVLRAAV